MWDMDMGGLAIGLTVVAAIAFLSGTVLDAVVKENGFGPTGNALLVTAGFVTAVYLANRQGLIFADLKLATAYGLGGGFALFAALALIKAGLARR
ncbi:hypothetical protein ASD50_00880 [Mesorhizobium sp. Root552]|jgi:hypothetical protein|uniref:hypothetical protein n=1 Tax=Mesorhizobium sp. Root552 TaxID=1736555 RepID=UPI000700D696|nr:hypothetical protein [Mesorhizobium sp. Root552]KQZ33470.1 hypothetical protein ASD50_00880 [Mesorhizobium sp. Root552]